MFAGCCIGERTSILGRQPAVTQLHCKEQAPSAPTEVSADEGQRWQAQNGVKASMRPAGMHLRVAEIAQLDQRPRAADEQGVFQLNVPVRNPLRMQQRLAAAISGCRSVSHIATALKLFLLLSA